MRRHAIERASWIWHPDPALPAATFLRFELAFAAERASVRFHVSADQFLALFCDDVLLLRVPAAPDAAHWPFHTYTLTLPAGQHLLRAEVWCLGENLAPGQRISLGGGFILSAEGEWHTRLSTGHAPWTVSRVRGIEPLPPVPHLPVWIGCGLRHHLGAGQDAAVPPWVHPNWWDNPYGLIGARWKLEPVEIPDPREERRADFTIVARLEKWIEPDDPFPPTGPISPAGTSPIAHVPPHSACSLLLDLGDYLCGWPELGFSGGAGATLDCRWAESLIEPGSLTAARHSKGDRAASTGKCFLGFGDEWIADGRAHTVSTHWWRAGRFVLLRVRTLDAPLELTSFAVRTTGYPWSDLFLPTVGDEKLSQILGIAARGFLNCTHDLFIDCPYYEQLQYAADTRIMMLVSYVCTGDDRLARRAIAQFDRARVHHGLPPMRAPSRTDMVSATFALWWIGMVADFARWRRDRAFVAARLDGVRATLAQLDEYRNANGLLEAVPGWPFVDWGTAWDDPAHPERYRGIPPQAQCGVSALINLHDACAREQAALLEDYAGLPELARRRRAEAAAIRAACRCFIDPDTGLVRDADGLAPSSEHAQIFALLAGLFQPDECARPLAALRDRSLPSQASIYFTHHLFDVFSQHGCAASMLGRLAPWTQMIARNLRTPWEEPEPSRSDCHGWGSHPLFHLVHGLIGLHPVGMEFRRAVLRPDLGSLPFVHATIPHPDGPLDISLERQDAGMLRLKLSVPVGLTLVLPDRREIAAGQHTLELADPAGERERVQRHPACP